jgi:hypothetical protein
MKLLALAPVLVVLSAIAAAPPAAKRPTIAYRIPGQDPLSIKFRKALDGRIAKDRQLRYVTDLKAADLQLVSPARNVDWDTLGGKMVVIYILSVEGNGKDYRLSGVCYANDMDKCARDILDRSKHYSLGF